MVSERTRNRPAAGKGSEGPSDGPQDQLMSIEELAAYLQVSVQTIYGWRHRREGLGTAAMKVGRALRWRRSQVDAWLEQQTIAAGVA